MPPRKDDTPLDTATAVEAIANLAVSGMVPQSANDRSPPFVVIPEGHTLAEVPWFETAPQSTEATYSTDDEAGFIAYVNKFKDWVTPAIFSNRKENKIVAVLDYHQDSTVPRYGEHRAVLGLTHSDEYKAWIGRNKNPMDQRKFIDFLEEWGAAIVGEDQMKIIELAKFMKISKSVEFKSGVSMANGNVHFEYVEAKGAGSIDAPEVFDIAIPVYENGEIFPFAVRLRYDLGENGKLSFVLAFLRPEAIVKEAIGAIEAKIASETNIPVWQGSVSIPGRR